MPTYSHVSQQSLTGWQKRYCKVTCIVLNWLVCSLLENVTKEAQELLNKKSDSKVLILLDILDNLTKLVPQHHSKVYCPSSHGVPR